jgi:hypothetical protein
MAKQPCNIIGYSLDARSDWHTEYHSRRPPPASWLPLTGCYRSFSHGITLMVLVEWFSSQPMSLSQLGKPLRPPSLVYCMRMRFPLQPIRCSSAGRLEGP